ncbi:MAG: hypothetical protein J7L08_03235 [Candidatus Aenigmarchaeota archaeon]|nr:hypothetical protein [Candidatus Aenigmarchaeota archaeon]
MEKEYEGALEKIKETSFLGLGYAVETYGTDISGCIHLDGPHHGIGPHVQSSFGPIGGGRPVELRKEL